jgi:uncharacterized protein (TIGR02145 family)
VGFLFVSFKRIYYFYQNEVLLHPINSNSMKRGIFLMIIFCALKATAQDYDINFTGSGLSSTVTTVKVENLTQGTTLSLSGTDILRLTLPTGVKPVENNQSSCLKLYPNPMTEYSTLEIFPPASGNAIISISDMTGKQVARKQSFLENQRQEFRLSGIKNGLYFINVKGNSYQLSGKLLSDGKSNGRINIEKGQNKILSSNEKSEVIDSKGTQGTVYMAYTSGDRLKFTGTSTIYSTIKTDIPTQSKAIDFKFIECKDGDNNNYPVVQIGTQVWMAENLKTTKFNDGSNIPNLTDNTEWANVTHMFDETGAAYCFYNNDLSNKNIYGALYNWYSIHTDKLCPANWYVASNAEWWSFGESLVFEAAGGKLKETGTSHWISPNTGANNMTGFTALPGGCRNGDGSFQSLGLNGYWLSSTSDGMVLADSYLMYNNNEGLSWDANSIRAGLSVRCLYRGFPTVSTTAVTTFSSTTAVVGGNVTSEGISSLVKRGVYWGTSANPESTGTELQIGNGTGTFSTSISGLSPNTIYYVKAYATNSAGTSYGTETSFKTALIIGDNYQGGKVAYILQPEDPGYIAGDIHGLIAAPADQSIGIQWYNGSFVITGATGTGIGTGNSNTNAIVAIQGAGSYAARLCYDLDLNGFSDWYLPSIDELAKLYVNRILLGASGNLYWSSSEYSFESAHMFWFYNGGLGIGSKITSTYVRAIRSF